MQRVNSNSDEKDYGVHTLSQDAVAPSVKPPLWAGCLPLLLLPAAPIVFRDRMVPWVFMWTLSFALFAGLKWMTWWQARSFITHTAARSAAYMFAWPGMDAAAFLDSGRHPQSPRTSEWLWAATKTALGIALLWFVARQIPAQQALLRGWIGLFGLIFLLHFGSFHLIALFWQSVGIEAQPIMQQPILARSLSEFWGKRWNLGFRQLAHEFVFRPAQRVFGATAAGLLVFLVSGLIHDMVISLPARGGYGLPTAYFLLQGLAVVFERSDFASRIGLRRALPVRFFAWIIAAAPAFWLFHPPFVMRVILPFMHAIHAL